MSDYNDKQIITLLQELNKNMIAILNLLKSIASENVKQDKENRDG